MEAATKSQKRPDGEKIVQVYRWPGLTEEGFQFQKALIKTEQDLNTKGPERKKQS